jgi:hypothetical protein
MNIQPASLYVDKFHPNSSHMLIAHWLESYPAGTRILDVGTASGTIGRFCKGKQFFLSGIEPEKNYSKLALPFYDELINTDLEHAPDEKISDFRVVICADVLEHIPWPEKSLRRLIDLQSGSTDFIISVPNIANVWVRINLLLGRFEYSDRGILDRNHLRFFTRKTFLKMLQEAGLAPIEIRVTPIPLDLVHPFFSRNLIGTLMFKILFGLTKVFPTLLGYQWLSLSRVISDE